VLNHLFGKKYEQTTVRIVSHTGIHLTVIVLLCVVINTIINIIIISYDI